MLYCFLLLGIISIIDKTNSYVLVQVRKGDNESKVDAVIHKTLPVDTYDKIASHIARRHSNNYKRFEIKKRADEILDKKEDTDSMVTLGPRTERSSRPTTMRRTSLDGIDKIEESILNFAKKGKNGPIMRAKEEYNIRPELIHFRNMQPSMMVELNSDTIISAVQDLLSSKIVKKYADQVAQKAAVVYRALKDEIGRENSERTHKRYNTD